MNKYWASVNITASYTAGLYDEDYIEAETEEEAKDIALQRAREDVSIDNAVIDDIEVICVGEANNV